MILYAYVRVLLCVIFGGVLLRFVIGGADCGKRDFVRENYGIDEILIADYDSVFTAKAVYGFHIFIKKLMADGKDNIVAVVDEDFGEKSRYNDYFNRNRLRRCSVEKGDREWRETVGRTCCYIAKKRTKSCEVVCGGGNRIK